MIDMSKYIKQEYSVFKVSDKLIEDTIRKAKLTAAYDAPKKPSKFRIAAAIMVLCLAGSSVAIAGALVDQNIFLYGEALPELDAMKAYDYYEAVDLQPVDSSTPIIYSREYEDFNKLKEEIHKDLLMSPDSNAEYQDIYYETDKKDYEYIRYQTSTAIDDNNVNIETQIFIALSDSQIQSFSQDLLGDYTFRDDVLTKNGNKALIVNLGVVNRNQIIFVEDGILYQFEAPVSAEQLLEYVNGLIK